MELTRQLNLLDTKTAFAVSAEANEYALTEAKICPFHFGDINIPIPENNLSLNIDQIKNQASYI